MTATRDRDPHYVIKNRAQGYEWEDGQLVGRDYDLTDVFSAGAIVSTVQDLEKWEAGFSSVLLVKPSSIEQIWTPVRLNSGTGKPSAEMLTKDAFDSLSSDPERADWQRIAAYGQLRAFTLTGREIEGSRRTLSYRAEVAEHLLLLSFALNCEGKISELNLEEEE